ncbi:MAG: radical SAM family heme chaperone HemW [Lentisphaerae bacterium]|nr:radical SAM family heme chaperone HemW [Lentisphaerota bacterium]MCP4100492.1 radical SAM family heme chaperone HemW [Lentisphaerota bacterium]
MNFENIYVHVPFCQTKCDYCGFYSVSSPEKQQVDGFIDKIEQKLNIANLTRPVDSLYFGGGTPSLLRPEQLQRLMDITSKYIPLSQNSEVTMECNPETLCPERLDIIRPVVNRVSIGIQSFDDDLRDKLGRKSHQEHISNSLEMIKKRNFDNINIDLIFGIPGQTDEDWISELNLAVNSNINHISCYSLTIEEGTQLAEKIENLDPIDDENTASMWERTGKFLENRGFPRYEVSNYSVPGAECRHNMNVWYGKTYLGLGPAASSFDGRIRWTQPHCLDSWLGDTPPEKDIIEPEYRMIEIFIIGLRTVRGWDSKLWASIPLQQTLSIEWPSLIEKALKVKHQYPELLAVEPDSIKLTTKGLLFWNTIAEAWLE